MAGKSASITVRILGDASGAKNAADEAEGAYGGLSKKMSGFAAGIGAAVGTLAIDMGQQLVASAGEWVNLAKEAEIFGKKADVVFGDSSASIKKWADEVNESFGLSDEKVVGLAASMGDLLVPLGFSRDAAAEMSKEAINLAGALSAWSGGTVDAAGVSDVLTKAMLGETDGLKSLGIAISAEEVARKIATMAAEGQTFATEAQAKAAATMALILEKSTDAQTAWADGTMDSVKAQNTASAGWADMQVMLGQVLLPVLQAVTAFVAENLPAAINFAKTVIDGIVATFGFLAENIEYVIPIFGAAAIAIGASLVPAFIAWATAAATAATATLAAAAPFIGIGIAIAAVAAALIYAYQHWDGFRKVIDAIANFITGTLWPVLKNIASVIITVVGGAVSGLVATATALWSALQVVWDKTEGLRSLMAGGFAAAIGVVKVAWETMRTAIGLVVSAVQTVWDKTEGVRSFLAGAFTSGINIAKGAWDGFVSVIRTVANAIQTVIDKATSAINKLRELKNGKTVSLIGGLDTSQFEGNATGTNFWKGGPTWVGERGPELIWANRGAMIQTASASKDFASTMANSGSGRAITLVIEGTPFKAMIAEYDAGTSMQALAGSRF